MTLENRTKEMKIEGNVEKRSEDAHVMSFAERCRHIIAMRKDPQNGQLASALKMEFRSCDEENMILEVTFPVQEWQLNPRSELNGGFLATFFDMGMGIAAYCASGRWQCATADLSVSFLRPLMKGQNVCIRSNVVKAGRNMIFVTAEAVAVETGKIAGISNGTFMTLAGVELDATSR